MTFTFNVTNLNDNGIGSLRQAILDANNATATDDTIVFSAGLSGVLLTSGNFVTNGNLVVNGPGASLTLNGNNANRIFTINSGRTVTLSNLKLQHGGIQNSGALMLNSSIIQSSVWSNGGGGAINNNGTLIVNNSTLLENEAASGGGIESFNGTVTVNNSVISGNFSSSGGGIYNDAATLMVNNSTLSDSTVFEGGGIYSTHANSAVTMNGSTLSGNTAEREGGGIYLVGPTDYAQ